MVLDHVDRDVEYDCWRELSASTLCQQVSDSKKEKAIIRLNIGFKDAQHQECELEKKLKDRSL